MGRVQCGTITHNVSRWGRWTVGHLELCAHARGKDHRLAFGRGVDIGALGRVEGHGKVANDSLRTIDGTSVMVMVGATVRRSDTTSVKARVHTLPLCMLAQVES